MNLCSSGHEEVCYESRNCPACTIKDELAEADSEIKRLENIIDDLNNKD